MPIPGKVGISPVCILGLNVNKGQEILLRLRTDDLKGKVLYPTIPGPDHPWAQGYLVCHFRLFVVKG